MAVKAEATSSDGEVYRSAFGTSSYPFISYGLPFPQACAKHVANTFNASKVYIIASGSLSNNTDYVQQLQDALGQKVVGTRKGMTPHTLWSECLNIAEEARQAKADLLITLGAGSLTDAAKIIALALANDAKAFDDLAKLTTGEMRPPENSTVKKATVAIISVPTSLSGGEYSDLAGGTNDETHRKHPFIDGTKGPSLVLLDPQLTTTTPDKYWLSTGIRAVDHCVEAMCSLQSTPESDANSSAGLKLLVPGLLKSKKNAQDLDARLSCQMGVIEGIKAVFQHHIPMGASHGIGHQLGPLGVGHGETSCINLPAVCKYNASANGKQQNKVRDVLRSDEEVRKVLKGRGLGDDADLGDMLDAIISELGMPRSLKDVGVGDDKLDLLAENSLSDKWCTTNPIPLTEKSQVMEILQMIKG